MTTSIASQESIGLRTLPEIKTLIVRAGLLSGVSLSALLLGAAQERAKQVLAESESLVLTSRDWDVFVAALDGIDKPRPRLSTAMRRHRDLRVTREPQ